MRTVKNLGNHELIGLRVSVARSDAPTILEYEGVVMDETMNTFEIANGPKSRVVPKTGHRFMFHLDDKKVLLDGNNIKFRPEDRTKKVRPGKSGR